jgi:hypothetical protein
MAVSHKTHGAPHTTVFTGLGHGDSLNHGKACVHIRIFGNSFKHVS